MGYKLVWISACPAGVQQEWAEWEDLGFVVLSDEQLVLARVLGLSTHKTLAGWAYGHLALAVRECKIVQAFRPEDSLCDAQGVVAWISRCDV